MLWHWQLLGTLLMAVQATSLLEEALADRDDGVSAALPELIVPCRSFLAGDTPAQRRHPLITELELPVPSPSFS